MINADKYANLMEKGDNYYHKSFQTRGKASIRNRKLSKRFYRKADYMKTEAASNKVDNRKFTISPTVKTTKFSLFGSLFTKTKKR